TPSGITSLAILPSVSPRWIGPYSLPPAIGPAGVTGRLGAGAAAFGSATGAGAGAAAGAGRDSGAADTTGAGAGGTPGGSSSAVYSRESRPEDQVNSTSRSMNGSVTGRVETTLRKC